MKLITVIDFSLHFYASSSFLTLPLAGERRAVLTGGSFDLERREFLGGQSSTSDGLVGSWTAGQAAVSQEVAVGVSGAVTARRRTSSRHVVGGTAGQLERSVEYSWRVVDA